MNKITVIIPAYNAEEYIAQCLNSVLNQKMQYIDRIIVVNDGSTDRTEHILSKICKQNANLVIINQENLGVSAARNRGIMEASTEWILLLDSDDECADDLIESHVNKLAEYDNLEDIAMIYTAYQQIDSNSMAIHQAFQGHRIEKQEGVCDLFMRNPIISPSGTLIHREKIIEEGLFKTNIACDEDVDLWIRLVEKYSIEYIDAPLTLIRRHAANTTAKMSVSLKAESELLEYYGLTNIKEKMFSRKRTQMENTIDYSSILIKLDLYKECDALLSDLKVDYSSYYYKNYLFIRAVCFIQLRNFVAAKLFLQDLLNIHPENGAALNNLAVIYSVEKNDKLAFEYYNRALLLYPNYMDASQNKKVLEMKIYELPNYKFTLRQLRPVLIDYCS